jgi:hypothetical protein
VVFCADALVHHEIHPSSLTDVLTKTRTYEGLLRLVLKYPDLQQYFDGPLVLSRRHRHAALAGGGVLLGLPGGRRAGRRRLFGALLCLPYARHRVTREPMGLRRRECIARLPQLLAIDLAELISTVVARWRYRGTARHK